MTTPRIERTDVRLEPDASRVLIRPFVPEDERVVRIVSRIAAQLDAEVDEHLGKIFRDFDSRHIEVESAFLERYESVRHLQITDQEPSHERKLLIGAYFTSEYSLESAALCNPSVVPHPDQTGLPAGSLRVVLSLRAVGEGHISSVAFRCGTIDAEHRIVIEDPPPFVVTPHPVASREFDKRVLAQKIMDMGFANEYTDRVFALLPPEFTYQELQEAVAELLGREPALSLTHAATRKDLFWVASSNYDIRFDASVPLRGRALFPYSPSEKHGIEDARFVRFVEDGAGPPGGGDDEEAGGGWDQPDLEAAEAPGTCGAPRAPGDSAATRGGDPATTRGGDPATTRGGDPATTRGGDVTYYATATAWDGKNLMPQLIATRDFLTFQVRTLNGQAVRNKGMALFPRKIHGRYAMLARLDNENIYLMYSEQLQFWRKAQIILRPTYPWEFYQIGNCGSPLETDAGWLVITHGVGAMRRYAIGAALLDRDDPARVLGRTDEPFLVPMENEREGYVPNVVYSCGALIHRGKLVLPYAMADYATRVVLVDLRELLSCLVRP
jgi:hypothetical protein